LKAKELILREFYSPEEDELSKAHFSDIKRPKLTLKHLHSLRKMREVKDVDDQEHLELVQKIYAPAEEDSGL
jgi:hypothetical protein